MIQIRAIGGIQHLKKLSEQNLLDILPKKINVAGQLLQLKINGTDLYYINRDNVVLSTGGMSKSEAYIRMIHLLDERGLAYTFSTGILRIVALTGTNLSEVLVQTPIFTKYNGMKISEGDTFVDLEGTIYNLMNIKKSTVHLFDIEDGFTKIEIKDLVGSIKEGIIKKI